MAVGARLLLLGETLSKGLLAKLECGKEEFRCSGAVYLTSNQMLE